MPKIIGEDVAITKQITCRNCGARLEYTPSELQSRHGRDYTGGPDGSEWIVCPRCAKEVTVRSW